MHRETRRPLAVWIELAVALVIAAVAIMSPHFAITDLDESTAVTDVAGARVGTATVHTTAAPGQYALPSVNPTAARLRPSAGNPDRRQSPAFVKIRVLK